MPNAYITKRNYKNVNSKTRWLCLAKARSNVGIRDRPKPVLFSGFGCKWRHDLSPVMAVTEITTETDSLLTAVTVAETETGCRPTDNDSRVNEACAPKP